MLWPRDPCAWCDPKQDGNMIAQHGLLQTTHHGNLHTVLLEIGFRCWMNVLFSLQAISGVKKTRYEWKEIIFLLVCHVYSNIKHKVTSGDVFYRRYFLYLSPWKIKTKLAFYHLVPGQGHACQGPHRRMSFIFILILNVRERRNWL